MFKRYYCFAWICEPQGGMLDFIGAANTIRDAVIVVRNHNTHYLFSGCHIWDMQQDKCLMEKHNIDKYILTPFELTNQNQSK